MLEVQAKKAEIEKELQLAAALEAEKQMKLELARLDALK